MEHQVEDQESIVQNLRGTLLQKETEATELREALKNLLDSHVRTKSKRAKELSDVRKRYSKRLVQMKIDLETHDIHFTNYAEDQMQLETKALLQDNNKEDGDSKSDGRMAQQHLISKLVADHTEFENRYKRDCADYADRIQELEDENRRLRRSLRNDGDALLDGKSTVDDNDRTYVLRRLEKENAKLSLSVNELKEKIHSLELKHILFGTSSDTTDMSSNKAQSVDNDRSAIALLHKEIEFKDRTIALLKTKAIAYQTRNLWHTDSVEGLYPNFCSMESSPASPSPSPLSSPTVIRDLKQRIQELEHILIRKEKELRSRSKSHRKKGVL